jgi:prephenate dehydrogenase
VSIQITIIGMGQLGVSMGLALAAQKDAFLRVGNDKDVKRANRAKQLGAIDRVEFNLPSSVVDAAIVILALPLDQIRDTLSLIASDLKKDAIVMDTAPVKADVIQWASELLPPGCHYIGLAPVLNPAYLDTSDSGIEAARADLFKNGLMAIVCPPGEPAEAIKLATDFCSLLGASHLFIDPVELDSMMASTHILPQLLAVALLNSTVDRPGWYDARKLAGRAYAQVISAIEESGEGGSLTSQALTAQVHLIRHLDVLIDTLYALRQQLDSNEKEKFLQELEKAIAGREKWLNERRTGAWFQADHTSNVVLPTAAQEFKRMFTFGGGRKPKQPK